jgi:hypothetical protein
MGAGLGGALAGTALGTDRGRVVVVDTALLGRSHSSAGRRPREKDISPAPGARGVSRTPWWSTLLSTVNRESLGGQKNAQRLVGSQCPLLLRFPFVQHGETKIASRQNFEK